MRDQLENVQQFIDMSTELFTMFLAVMVVYLVTSLEVQGQSTVDDGESCSFLPSSDDVANLIRVGVEKVITSHHQQQLTPPKASRHPLVSALVGK